MLYYIIFVLKLIKYINYKFLGGFFNGKQFVNLHTFMGWPYCIHDDIRQKKKEKRTGKIGQLEGGCRNINHWWNKRYNCKNERFVC